MKKGKVFCMFNIKENFPALYQDILDNIPSETAQKLKSKISFIETNKEEVLEYLHDYSKVSQDVFDNLEVWSYMEEYSEEIDEFLEGYPKLDFDRLCELIEEAIVKLVKKANLRGGTDNISIAYLKKESGES